MIFIHLAIGISLALVEWAYVLLLGFLALSAASKKLPQLDRDFAPTNILVASCAGIALQIFMLFCIASLHQLHPLQIVIVLALAPIVLLLRVLPIPMPKRYARDLLATSFSVPWLLVFGVCAILSAPALLPPNAYDSTMYHYAYAVDWSNAGGLTVDPYLHFPLAQFNVELLYAACFALHLTQYVEYINWLFFTITATGIVSLTTVLLRRAGANGLIAGSGALVSSAVFISCPLVIGQMDVGYIDIPAGTMMLGFATAALRARRDFRLYGLAMALIGGSFIGIKFSFVPCILLFGLLTFFIGRVGGAHRYRIAAYLAIFAVVLSPWFIRNLIVAGDPLDPVINLALHHSDPFWTAQDLAIQKADLNRPVAPWEIPVWQYLNPTDSQAAISLSVCFLYVPILGLFILLLSKPFRERVPDFYLINVIIVYAMAEQFAVSNRFNRYDLHFYGLFLAYMALASWYFFDWLSRTVIGRSSTRVQIFAVLVLLVMVLPPPTPIIEYNNLRTQFSELHNVLDVPDFYLKDIPGYNEARDLASLIAASHTERTVLNIGNNQNVTYFFRRDGVVSLGDNWGPGRYFDLRNAVASVHLGAYLAKFDVGAVMILKANDLIADRTTPNLHSELVDAGFREITEPESDTRAFARPDVIEAAARNGFSVAAERAGTYYFEDHIDDAVVGNGSTPAPDQRSVFAFGVLDGGESVNAMTVIGGNSASFDRLKVGSDSILTFDVAKAFPIGTPCVAWIDIKRSGRTSRLFTTKVAPATGDGPVWQHVKIALGAPGTIALVFGSDSIPGGGAGDWAAYAHPQLTDARQLAPIATPAPRPLGEPQSSLTIAKPAAPGAIVFDAVRDFQNGTLGDQRAEQTPSGKAGLVLPIGTTSKIETLTLVAPEKISYANIVIPKNANLTGSVAYPFPSGDGVNASIVIEPQTGNPERLFSVDILPTGSNEPIWKPFEISLARFAGQSVTIEFRSDIRNGAGGNAAWASFRAQIASREK